MSQNSEPAAIDQPWSDLATIAEVELWIAQYDQTLQQHVGKAPAAGQGVCFQLAAGGVIYLHTNGDGDIILDLEPDAAWVIPVIIAATRVLAPPSRLWVLPGDVLIPLIFGLNPLIASARVVRNHPFRMQYLRN